MTINERQIYYALDKITYLAGKGVTVSLSVKNDGSFDMNVNPHILGMIDDDDEDDEDEIHHGVKGSNWGIKNNFDSLMKEIQDYGISVNPHILKIIMEENRDKDDQK